jgi:hypothetical protein
MSAHSECGRPNQKLVLIGFAEPEPLDRAAFPVDVGGAIISCLDAIGCREESSLLRSISPQSQATMTGAPLQHRPDPVGPCHPPASDGTDPQGLPSPLGADSIVGQ